MWTSLLIFASVVLLGESFQDFVPVYPPPINTFIRCMVPGPYEATKKRFVSPPMRVPIPEPILELQLLPRGPKECWELPPIQVKEPYVPVNNTAFIRQLNMDLERMLAPTPQMRLITTNVEGALVPNDPNSVYGIAIPEYQIPDELLAGLSVADQNIIRTYVANFRFGECDTNPQVIERPAFYYPRYQVQGKCDGRKCALPPTEDHDFSQKCRPFIGGENQIYIRALRWDCCHSYTGKVKKEWDYICGWRMVRFPVVHQCDCSCDPSEQ